MLQQNKNPFELTTVSVRLVKDAPILSEQKITSPEAAITILGEYLCEFDREVICVVNLKNDGTPINCHFASVGALDHAIAHPRELFKASILSNASSMLLLHNHITGKLAPSEQDVMTTDQMIQLCDKLQIPLLDHIIVGGDHTEYFSFREKGILPVAKTCLETDYEKLDFPVSVMADSGKER